MDPRPVVLIVEDDVTQKEFAAAILRTTDRYDVITADSAEEGMRLAEQRKPALIVSDHYMPGETGVEFCKRVKTHPLLRGTMFMMLTAESEVGHRILAVDLGADEYIPKPYNADELLTRVRALVRIHELQLELSAERDELRWTNDVLQGTLDGVTHLLGRVIAIRVPNAAVRADLAAHLCQWMGDRLHLPKEDRDQLELAARLHEIGKIGLEDDLLRKSHRDMSPAEWDKLNEFALFSQRIMEGISQFEAVAGWLRHQMENFDGTGYPDRRRGEEIPLQSRILRAVNFVEQTPREGTDKVGAFLAEIDRVHHTVFDPRIAQLLKEYILVQEQPAWLEGKRQVSVFDLEEGMITASDVTTGSGTKLLPRDVRITRQQIERIRAQHHHDPIINSIYIHDRT